MNDSLEDTIEPKSDQLNADDLITGPITVTITAVKRSVDGNQPIDVHITGNKPYRPCKSMRRVLIAAWGKYGSDWVGKSLTLYCDPSVMFGGVAVGGIRISHMSHIAPLDVLLTTAKAKRRMFHIEPLEVVGDYPQADFEANVDAWVEAIKSGKLKLSQLFKRVASKGELTPNQIDMIEKRLEG